MECNSKGDRRLNDTVGLVIIGLMLVGLLYYIQRWLS